MNYGILYETACYQNYSFNELAYAPKWYYIIDVKLDTYSHRIVNSKRADESRFFLGPILNLLTLIEKFECKVISEYDLIEVMPGHESDSFSPTLSSLAGIISNTYGIDYSQTLQRIKSTRPDNGTRERTADKKFEYVTESLTINAKVSGKKIILLDDVKTTGINILEAKKMFLEAGADSLLVVCLGINSQENKDHIVNMIEECEDGSIWRMSG